MAKPSVTTIAVKEAPLTYAELDANFTNLRDATLTVSDGVNSTPIDLNGTITFAGGDNVTVTENNGVITVSSTASGGSAAINDSGQMQTDLDLRGFRIASTFSRVIGGVTYPAGTAHVIGKLDASDDITTSGQLFVEGNNIYGATTNATLGGRIFLGNPNGNATQLVIASANGAGTVELVGNIKVNDPGGAPANTTTIVDWLKITMGSTVYYLPLYQ